MQLNDEENWYMNEHCKRAKINIHGAESVCVSVWSQMENCHAAS